MRMTAVLVSLMSFLTVPHATASVWKQAAFGSAPGDAVPFDPSAFSVLRITGTGRDAYLGRDEGTFVFVETDRPAFRLTVRMAEPPDAARPYKAGLMVRDSLAHSAKAVSLRHDNYEKHRCLQWFVRFRPADVNSGHQLCFRDGTAPDLSLGAGRWLRIERDYPAFRLSTSSDGRTWAPVPGDYQPALVEQKVLAGFFLTSGPGAGEASCGIDSLSFEPLEPSDAGTVSRYVEYRHVDTCEALLLRVRQETFEPVRRLEKWEGKTPADEHSLILVKPPAGTPIRGLLYTTGNKEFDSASDPNHQFWNTLGFARAGGYFKPKLTDKAFAVLEKEGNLPGLTNMPFVVTGGSFAGGFSGEVAWLFPEKTIASAPLTLGMPVRRHLESGERRHLDVPILSVYGSHDGAQMEGVMKLHPLISKTRALYAHAPIWWVKHANTDAYTLVRSYFQEVIRMRLPAQHDYTTGPATLATLKHEEGWYGDTTTWKTSHPRIVPVREYEGDTTPMVWLPNRKLARIWQSFVSFAPRTVILWPYSDGQEWEGSGRGYNCMLEARKPFPILAMGPTGPGLKVEYFAGDEPLRVLSGSGYQVVVDGLEPGYHAIYAVTTLGDLREISRPVGILFQERKPASPNTVGRATGN